MTDSIAYQIERTHISEENMQFQVVNRRPKYPAQKRETAKADIEKQLFAVFCKYACPD